MTLKPFWHDLAIFPSEPLLVPRSKPCGKHQKGSTCKYPLGTYSVQGTVALEYTGFLRQCFALSYLEKGGGIGLSLSLLLLVPLRL